MTNEEIAQVIEDLVDALTVPRIYAEEVERAMKATKQLRAQGEVLAEVEGWLPGPQTTTMHCLDVGGNMVIAPNQFSINKRREDDIAVTITIRRRT